MKIYQLKRFHPTEIQIQITDKQLIQMFPIEVQEHPFMGQIQRVWKTEDFTYSIGTSKKEDILDLSKDALHLQLKKEKMEEILQTLEEFKIILYYEDKEDIYEVKREK
ncbi:MAG: hypothetical protein DSY47_01505 [Hydrogenothermus sp.]|nr:MAG: hypothetical protein DSY47_01505 [Hydrogenothermus sp.]